VDPSLFRTIRYETNADLVATVTLDRPDRHNAFTSVMCEELAAVWHLVRADDDVRAVVLTAAGNEAFCTGIDRDEVPVDDSSAYDPLTYEDPGALLGPKANDCWKPVVAAVNGMACGGAFYLLGEVDVVVAAEHATFFDPHVTYGMPAVFEPILMLAKLPFGEVLRMSLLGGHERLSAQRASEVGFVTEVVEADRLSEAAHRIAAAIASQPPAAVQATLRTIWAAQELSRRQAIELGNTFLNLAMTPEALAEGQATFASGRRIDPFVR
jgi:enoyl-CoA hydratase/carnithine racemase